MNFLNFKFKKSKSVSRVLSWIAIYLEYILLYISSRFSRNRRAVLCSYISVAPGGVYTVPICHHISGELLPRLFTLTKLMAFIFCCTFLKVTLTGRYPAPLLYGARTFLIYLKVYATIQFTLCFILN